MKKYSIVLCLFLLALVSVKASNLEKQEETPFEDIKKNETTESSLVEIDPSVSEDTVEKSDEHSFVEKDSEAAINSDENSFVKRTLDSNTDGQHTDLFVREEASAKKALQEIRGEKNKIINFLAKIKTQLMDMEAIKKAVSADVQSNIKSKGLYLGNRWRIAEEGTGTYEALVFRDMTTTQKGTDRRYAFYKERYTDK